MVVESTTWVLAVKTRFPLVGDLFKAEAVFARSYEGLDEPDVFLDFENMNGLCELINSYKGTLLVITHNRYLLKISIC